MQVSGGGGAQGCALAQMRERLLNRADSDRSRRVSLDEFAQIARRGTASAPAGFCCPAGRFGRACRIQFHRQ